jgi:H+/Cl- antiporter ClcA
LIGASVALVAWWAPSWVGGGENIAENALTHESLFSQILLLLLLRHLLGALCYAAGTPGGVFAPMLALGALMGLMFGQLSQYLVPEIFPYPHAFALVGMTALRRHPRASHRDRAGDGNERQYVDATPHALRLFRRHAPANSGRRNASL